MIGELVSYPYSLFGHITVDEKLLFFSFRRLAHLMDIVEVLVIPGAHGVERDIVEWTSGLPLEALRMLSLLSLLLCRSSSLT